MSIVIVEIKALCSDPDRVRAFLQDNGARFVGEDHQVDTYFEVPDGRLKLREGSIENALIHYHRPDHAHPKRSDVNLYRTSRDSGLKDVLHASLKAWARVDKHREIWFIENVKFHLDRVANLGSFVEIEAISEDGTRSEHSLRDQCDAYMRALGIRPEDLLTSSYSDMLAS